MYAYSGVNDFYFFIYYLLSPLVVIFGLCGNLLALAVLNRKVMRKIGPVLMHKVLFIFDSLYLVFFIQSYLSRGFGINFLQFSRIGCKFFYFFVHSLAPISPLAIVYISLDRYISIKYPNRRLLLKKNREQIVSIALFITFNLLYKIPIIINYDISYRNGSQSCTIASINSRLLLTYMDVGFRIVFISVVMILITILIIYCIYKSRRRVMNMSTVDSRIIKKDIRLSVTSLLINFIYIILNMPLNFTSFFSSSIPEYGYLITLNLFYMSYSINFYIIVFTNSLFRREFLNLLRLHLIENYVSWISKPSNIFKNQQITNST